MHNLLPFTPGPQFLVKGALQWNGGELVLRIQLQDSQDQLLDGLKPMKKTEGRLLPRKNELWKTTCFEAFWGRPGEKSYWELNISGSGSWNLYHFDSYRQPQPPRASDDFTIQSLEIDGKAGLECRLATALPVKELEGSVCVIARTAEATHYFSTKHAGDKPDYHLRAGFVYLR